MSKTYRLIGNRFLVLSIFFIILQQVLVASSTWTIAHIGKKLATQQPVMFELIGYCTLLLIVYLPGIASLVFLEKAQITSLHTYFKKLLQKIYGKVAYHISKNDQEKLLPWINGQAQQTLEDAITHTYSMIATSLNALLNALVIAMMVDQSLLIAYGISMLICIIGVTTSHQAIQQVTKADIVAKASLSTNLLHLWDNIILGNTINKLQWSKVFSRRYQTFSQKKIALTTTSRSISSLIMIFATLPIGIAIILLSKVATPIILGALLLTLPRQIQIIQNFEAIVSNTIIYKQHVTKLNALYSTLAIRPSTKFTDYINVSRITINQTPLSKVNQEELLSHQAGRFTIRGENGAGKTCFLLHLKHILQEKAHFLPVDLKQAYYTNNKKNLSTGERMIMVLTELIHSEVPIILLDEWDANLDSDNVKAMDSLLDKLSKDKLVIEIRHNV